MEKQGAYSSYFTANNCYYECLVCAKHPTEEVFRAAKRQTIVRHVKKRHLNYKHSCSECSRVFRSQMMLDKHIERHHHSPEPEFSYSSYFMLSEGCYTCLACAEDSTQRPFVAEKRQRIVRHVKIQHLNYKYICKECSRAFSSQEMLNKHRKRHMHMSQEAREVTAPVSYSSYFSLDNGSYDCLVCEKDSPEAPFRVMKRQAIVRHVKKVHLNYSYTCKDCSRAFRSYDVLKSHMERHQHN